MNTEHREAESHGDERYTIGELADAADVSVRTVRYYIAEGLLPPPITAGARSYYTREHLDRLRVIGTLKDAFLPLREIRRQLASFDEEAIRSIGERMAAEIRTRVQTALQPIMDFDRPSPPPKPPGFRHGDEDIRPSPPKRPRARDDRPEEAQSPAAAYIAKVRGEAATPHPPAPPMPSTAIPMPMPTPPPRPAQDETTWRRIAISDEAELLIRDDAYGRRRDKIDWLVDWARRVLE